MSSTTERYLEFIAAHMPHDAVLGISTIDANGVYTTWYKRSQLHDAAEYIDQIDKRAHVYARITPLAKPPSVGRGKESASLGTSVLWLDVDEYRDPAQAAAALEALPQPPSMIVNSGTGLHAYWMLDTFYTDLAAIKARTKGLQQQLNTNTPNKPADSCFDLARIMRVPGTYNLKHDPPIQANIASFRAARIYKLDQFAPATEDDTDTAIPLDEWDHEPLPADFLETVRERDAKLYKRIMSAGSAIKADVPTTNDGEIDRSRNDAYIATRLLGLGYQPSTIISVLTNPQWLAGSKYAETGRYDYVVMTVNKAWQAFNSTTDRYFIKRAFQAETLASELYNQERFIYTAERLWRYRAGVYHGDGDAYLRAVIAKRLGKRWTRFASDEVIRWIEDTSRIDIDTTNQHHGLLNVANGMLDVMKGTVKPHDPGYLSLTQLPIQWQPNAASPALDRFLSQILPRDTIDTFWEYVGSAFETWHYYPKAFVALVGPPSSGKSKVLEWLVHFYGGRANVAAISLQTLADHKFASSELFGKMANIFSDLSEGEAQNTGQIKGLTGDDYVSGEKKFKGFYMFKNTARLFFSANHYPRVRNPDQAYFNRATIIRCENIFEGKDADPEIVPKLATPATFAAGLVHAIDGLRRLRTNGELTYAPSIYDSQAEYRYHADTVTGFWTDAEDDENYKISKQDAYTLYKLACKDRGRQPVSDDIFFRRVTENLDALGLVQVRGGTEAARSYQYVGKRPANWRVLDPAYGIRVVGYN